VNDQFPTIGAQEWRASTATGRKRQHDNPLKKLLALCLLGTAKLTASDDLAFIEAIAHVESGNVASAIGRAGEVSKYQLMPSTWRDRTDWPLSDAKNATKAQAVALAHLQWLRRHGKTDDYRTLAMMWRYGIAGWKHADVVERAEYSARILNVFDQIKDKGTK
jgi:hypothetical protein